MNKLFQQIAIAEACGWTCCGTQVFSDLPPHGYPPNVRKPTAKELIDGTATSPWDIPDYLTDLNAIWSAVRTGLSGAEQLRAYEAHLYDLSPDYPTEATAAQRAEAFLRTIGKWKENAE